MFIAPMLCSSLRDPNRLGDPRYVAEPKFDGQRAHVHVAGGRSAAKRRSANGWSQKTADIDEVRGV
jgi:ATP-dependent DNA ligase